MEFSIMWSEWFSSIGLSYQTHQKDRWNCNKTWIPDFRVSKTPSLKGGDLWWHLFLCVGHVGLIIPIYLHYGYCFTIYIIRQSTFSNKSYLLLNQHGGGITQPSLDFLLWESEIQQSIPSASIQPHEPPTTPTFQQEMDLSSQLLILFQMLNSDHSAIFCFLSLVCAFSQLLNVQLPLSLLPSLALSSETSGVVCWPVGVEAVFPSGIPLYLSISGRPVGKLVLAEVYLYEELILRMWERAQPKEWGSQSLGNLSHQ